MTYVPPPKVSTRSRSFKAIVEDAWQGDFTKPDIGYTFSNGRRFVNSDRMEAGGPYSVRAPALLLADGTPYPDMRDGMQANVGTPNGAAYDGFGSYEETVIDPAP